MKKKLKIKINRKQIEEDNKSQEKMIIEINIEEFKKQIRQ